MCAMLVATGVSAQGTFERYYPFGSAVDTQGGIVDEEGHLVIVGETEADIVVLRLQPDGELEWMRRYPIFTEEGLYGPAVVSTSEGIFVAGYTMGMGTGSRDGLLLHLDFDGTLLSAKRYDQGGQSNAFHRVTKTGHGFVVTGRYTGASSGYDMLLTSFDASGEMEWSRSYGSNDWDWGYQVSPLASGGYALVGYGDGLAPQTSAYVVRVDADGTELWARAIYSTGADEGYTVTEDAEGNLYVGGRTLGMGVPASVSAFITKLSANGDHLWTRVLPHAIEVIDLKAVAGGGVAWLARPQNVSGGFGNYDIGWGVLDAAGQGVITRIYGGAGIDNANTMVPAVGGGWYLMGSTNSHPEGWAFHLMRIDEQGQGACSGSDWDLEWQPYTPNVVPFTSVVSSGLTSAPVAMTTTVLSVSALNPCCEVDPAFTMQQSSADPFTWTFTAAGGAGTHEWQLGDGTSSTLPTLTHTYVGNGSYQVCHTLTVACGSATSCQPIALAVGVDEARAVPVRAYPVPANDEVRIETGNEMPTTVRLFDAQGRQVERFQVDRSGNGVVLHVAGLAPGSYWAELGFANNGLVRIPLVVTH